MVEQILKDVQSRFLPQRSNLIPALQVFQQQLGWIPKEAMLAIAGYLKVPESEVWGTATFYAQFRFWPVGRNVITVCRGTACHVRASAAIVQTMEKELGIRLGETTPDLSFTLQQVACFGSCALAPVVLINGKVYGRQSAASVKRLLDRLKRQTKRGQSSGS
jgi:NADH-quinone oxidoreductase subunit E